MKQMTFVENQMIKFENDICNAHRGWNGACGGVIDQFWYSGPPWHGRIVAHCSKHHYTQTQMGEYWAQITKCAINQIRATTNSYNDDCDQQRITDRIRQILKKDKKYLR